MRVRNLGFALVTLAIAAAGTYVSLGSIDRFALRTVLIVLFSVLVAVAAALEVSAFRRERLRGFRKTSKINRFMHDWISTEGRVAVFSRDMSWVEGEVHESWRERVSRRARRDQRKTTRELLAEKAGRGELIVCMPTRNTLAAELEREGASVLTYADLDLVPQSRFTIVRHGRADAHVAIGRALGGKHVIETFGNGQHPAFGMAEDLVRFVERVNG
jgi:hypothetical protein